MLEQVDQKLQGATRQIPGCWQLVEWSWKPCIADPEALQSFTQALAISPKFFAALEGRPRSAIEPARKTKEYLARILEQDPHNLTVHAMNGELAFEAVDCVTSNRGFCRAEEVVNSDATALPTLG